MQGLHVPGVMSRRMKVHICFLTMPDGTNWKALGQGTLLSTTPRAEDSESSHDTQRCDSDRDAAMYRKLAIRLLSTTAALCCALQ